MSVTGTYRIFAHPIADTRIDDFVGYALRVPGHQGAGRGALMTVFANTHVLMEGRFHASFDAVLGRADHLLPDGMPLVWIGRLKGKAIRSRVAGPALMKELLEKSRGTGLSHYFYGGRPETQERMIAELRSLFPGLKVAGHEAPPFRPLTPEEDAAAVERINASGADFVWVGLGCPKQEIWMDEHKARLTARMMFGVGQAFDIWAGTVRRAPAWMGDAGFEWLFRLCTDPGRLWKRYLVYAPLFALLVVWDEVCRGSKLTFLRKLK